MKENEILTLMLEILKRQGRTVAQLNRHDILREVSFRSLDFSELVLRIEDASNKSLNFDASNLRSINTVGDVIDFIIKAMPA